MSAAVVIIAAARRWPAAARWSSASRSAPRRGAGAAPAAAAARRRRRQLPGSLEHDAVARFLDPHRRRRRDHGLHRQGRARPGHQDRAAPDRRRGARCSICERSSSSPPDTARTPNEGYTSGSHSMQDSGTAIRNAAAQVRADPGRAGGAAQRRAGRSAQDRQRRGGRAGRPPLRLWRTGCGRACCTSRRSRNRR